MGTKTFSVGKRKARSSRGLAQSCSLSLAACSLPAAVAVRMIYIHFCLMTEALKSATLKKKMFLWKRLLWTTAKLSSLSL